ncbi:MAG: bifunctional phosphopantothenoylcysteine decarboxylase/phosphopantothenate synthase [Bacteroidaceae bacterium]|nr:bifunctional phosphopantothenoylcysteine decarboxylase/phosphopantothenate synthase [Bacteroidaceae bacterium]
MLEGRKIVLGITGSIAAYKACVLIRELVKRGAEVQVVITPAGKEFITPLTLSTLTRKPVVSEFFDRRDGSWHSHVDLGLWADAMVIAPCTAATLGKMANGIADNMLITTYLSMKAPVFIAPAMDLDMYRHPSTQKNIAALQGYGNHFIDAGTGFLASGLEGKGRMAEPEEIADALEAFFAQNGDLPSLPSHSVPSLPPIHSTPCPKGKVLITAGPTHEKIDPVRYIGNYSSGKMGFAIAEECAARGYDVTLIAGPVGIQCSSSIKRIDVTSAQEMFDAAVREFPQADTAILCAAVADYRPAEQADSKIKREKVGDITLHLTANPDIAAHLGQMKTSGQRLVGFALETDNEDRNAESKLKRKNLDFIVMNSMRNSGTTFGFDDNQITIISPHSKTVFDKKPKTEVAKDIIDFLEQP